MSHLFAFLVSQSLFFFSFFLFHVFSSSLPLSLLHSLTVALSRPVTYSLTVSPIHSHSLMSVCRPPLTSSAQGCPVLFLQACHHSSVLAASPIVSKHHPPSFSSNPTTPFRFCHNRRSQVPAFFSLSSSYLSSLSWHFRLITYLLFHAVSSLTSCVCTSVHCLVETRERTRRGKGRREKRERAPL